MIKPVTLSASAKVDFLDITAYLSERFGHQTAQHFIDEFQKAVTNIAANPRLYRIVFKRQKLRRCVLQKRCVIIYKTSRYHIEVVAIFDTRQDPGKLKGLI